MKQLLLLVVVSVIVGCSGGNPVAPGQVERVVDGVYPVVVKGKFPCEFEDYVKSEITFDRGKYVMCSANVKNTDTTWVNIGVSANFEEGTAKLMAFFSCAEYTLVLW